MNRLNINPNHVQQNISGAMAILR